MFAKKILVFIAAIAMMSLACGFTFNVPITTDVKIGPTITEEISVPDPDPNAESVKVSLSFGAGELSLEPGAESLVAGTAVFNIEDFRPEIKTANNSVEISTGNLEINGFPKLQGRMENRWDLKLSDRPLDLRVMAGAYSSDMELGGLRLNSVHITDGASDVRVNFSEPNQVEMSEFRYDSGASNVVLNQLGNANFKDLIFKGGAGNYELDFSGEFKNDATAYIETGLSSLTIRVPESLNVRVRVDSGLSNISTQGSWGQSGGVYTHQGDGPELDITIDIGAGNLILKTD